MNFDRINTFATEVANKVLVDVGKKEILRDNIINTVVLACISYEKDPKFKREINAYIEYLRRNN